MDKHFLQPPTCCLLNRIELCTHWNITNVKTGIKWWSFNTWKWTCRTRNCCDWVVACCETDEMIWMMREMENNCWSDEPSLETILTPETSIWCKDWPGAWWRQREGVRMTSEMRILPCSLWVTGSWRLSWYPTPCCCTLLVSIGELNPPPTGELYLSAGNRRECSWTPVWSWRTSCPASTILRLLGGRLGHLLVRGQTVGEVLGVTRLHLSILQHLLLPCLGQESDTEMETTLN